MEDIFQAPRINRHLGRLAFCKEKLIFGIVAGQDARGNVTKLWTPLGIIETVQLSILIVKSLWDLYKLIRMIWKEFKRPNSTDVVGWSREIIDVDDNCKNS